MLESQRVSEGVDLSRHIVSHRACPTNEQNHLESRKKLVIVEFRNGFLRLELAYVYNLVF